MPENKKSTYFFFKRIFDILLSVVFIVLSFPLQIVIFVLLLFELKEFPIFLQKRGITLEGKVFRIFKFKTIKSIPIKTVEHNIFLKTKLEKYIGPVSKILRKTGLDELPQLYNVLFGSMSLIGPRPLMLSDLELMKTQFPKHYEIRSRFDSKPGLSGMWQLFGNREEGIDNLIEIEKLYETNRSLKLDFQLLFYTFSAILFERNSDAILANQQKQKQTKVPFEFSLTQIKANLHLYKKDGYEFIKTLKKADSYYSLELPEDYWNTASTIEKNKEDEDDKKHLRIIKINNKSVS